MISRDAQLYMSLAGHPGNFDTRFHNYLYEKPGLGFIYRASTTQDIEAAVKGVRALGIRGCTVSILFRGSCMPFLDAIGPSAKAIDSVSTIANDNGTLAGFNTDYTTIRSLIIGHQLDSHTRVMIHDSGGMGKAVIVALRNTGFRDVVVAARNRENSPALAEQYGFQQQPQPEGITCDILVNVTPVDMAGGKESGKLAYSEAIIATVSVVFDAIALPPGTPVVKLAQQLDKKTISGAEVIVLQAVEQFVIYASVRPDDGLIAEAAESMRTG